MADNHGFWKPADPASNNDEDGAIIEISTDQLVYQMVPLRGRRRAFVRGPRGRDCTVIVKDPAIASMETYEFVSADNASTPVPPPVIDGRRQALPAGIAMRFDIRGAKAGKTEILLKDGSATMAELRVSVKPERVVTVSTSRISDIEFVSPYTEDMIRAAVARTTSVYKNTANVTLIFDPTIYQIECDVSIGNPVILGRQLTEYNYESLPVENYIKRNTPQAAKAANLVTVFGWTFAITHLPFDGLNQGRFCFLNHDSDARYRASVLEHEIGHALGLDHTAAKTIMHANTTYIERFEEDQIEALNPVP